MDFPNPPGTLGSPGIISLINGTNNTGTLLASTSGIPSTADSWLDYTVSFTNGPTASGDLIVELSVAGASTYQANFDNVQLTTSAAPADIPPAFTPNITALRSEVTTGGPVTYTVAATGTPPLFLSMVQSKRCDQRCDQPQLLVQCSEWHQFLLCRREQHRRGHIQHDSTGVVISAANLVTVNNFSFENGTHAGGGGQTIPLSWADFNNREFQHGGQQQLQRGQSLAPPADGNDFFAINEGPSDPTGGIYQDVGALLPNTTYTLTVATGRRMDFPNPPGSSGLTGNHFAHQWRQ